MHEENVITHSSLSFACFILKNRILIHRAKKIEWPGKTKETSTTDESSAMILCLISGENLTICSITKLYSVCLLTNAGINLNIFSREDVTSFGTSTKDRKITLI